VTTALPFAAGGDVGSGGNVELGTMSRNMAAQVEYAKYMIIVQLAWLSYEIAQWIVFLDPERGPYRR